MSNLGKQNGAALIIGLLMLLVMTLLGVTSMSTSTTALKMSVNTQIQNSAFQVAATALNHSLVNSPDSALNVDWGNTTANILVVDSVQKLDQAGTVPNSQMGATIQYIACAKNIIGESADARALVHKVTGTGSITNDVGTVISSNVQVIGVRSPAAGCPDDGLF